MEMKAASQPYEVPEARRCHCVVKAPVSGQDWATGWGWRLCAKCKGFIGWGVRG